MPLDIDPARTGRGRRSPGKNDLYQRKTTIKPFTISKNTTTKIKKKGGPSGIA
jgi:hypothetical protein